MDRWLQLRGGGAPKRGRYDSAIECLFAQMMAGNVSVIDDRTLLSWLDGFGYAVATLRNAGYVGALDGLFGQVVEDCEREIMEDEEAWAMLEEAREEIRREREGEWEDVHGLKKGWLGGFGYAVAVLRNEGGYDSALHSLFEQVYSTIRYEEGWLGGFRYAVAALRNAGNDSALYSLYSQVYWDIDDEKANASGMAMLTAAREMIMQEEAVRKFLER